MTPFTPAPLPNKGDMFCLWCCGWELFVVTRVYKNSALDIVVVDRHPGWVVIRRVRVGGTLGAEYHIPFRQWLPETHLFHPVYVMRDEFEDADIERIIPLLPYVQSTLPAGKYLTKKLFRRMITRAKKEAESNGKPNRTRARGKVRQDAGVEDTGNQSLFGNESAG